MNACPLPGADAAMTPSARDTGGEGWVPGARLRIYIHIYIHIYAFINISD